MKGTIAGGEAAGGEQAGLAELLLDPPHDPVDQPGEAEDEAGLDRAAAGAADRRLRLGQVDARDAGGPLDQRGQRDLEAGRDRAAEVFALGRDGVEVDPGAEVDDDAGAAEALVGGDRVDEPVGADLERVVDPDRHPGLHPGPDREEPGVEVALGQLLVLGAERRHDRGDADRVDVVEADPAEREQAADPLGQLVTGRPGAGLKAPVLDQALAVEGAEVGLGVADVDCEQHRNTPRVSHHRIGSAAMKVRLYTIPASHPGMAAQLMLEHKGIPFSATTSFPGSRGCPPRCCGSPATPCRR